MEGRGRGEEKRGWRGEGKRRAERGNGMGEEEMEGEGRAEFVLCSRKKKEKSVPMLGTEEIHVSLVGCVCDCLSVCVCVSFLSVELCKND